MPIEGNRFDEFLLGKEPHMADPPRPTITIAATDASAGEPNNSGTITLTRSGVTIRALPVYYTVYGTARAGTDYVALSGTAVFAVGQGTVDIVIQPVDDQSYEGVEDVTVQILPELHYQNATNALATVTIADNEKPLIRVAASLAELMEGSGTNGTFSFLREGDTQLPLTVNFTLTGSRYQRSGLSNDADHRHVCGGRGRDQPDSDSDQQHQLFGYHHGHRDFVAQRSVSDCYQRGQ